MQEKVKTTSTEEYDLKGFVYSEIVEECERYKEEEQIRYLKYVLFKWETDRPRLDPNGTLVPSFEKRIEKEIKWREEKIEFIQTQKISWNGNKGEFAIFINEEYLKNKKEYDSLRDASNKLFDKYKFKWKDWTKEQCYDIVKKK